MSEIPSSPINRPIIMPESVPQGGSVGETQKTSVPPNVVMLENLPPMPGGIGGMANSRQQIMSATLPPPPYGGGSGEVKSSTIQALGGLNQEGVSTDIYSVMAMIQKVAQSQRDSARQVRDASLQQQVTQLQGAADEIRKAAQDRFVGAVVQSAMQIGAGVAQIGAGVASAVQMGKATTMKEDPNIKANQQEIASLNKESEGLAGYTPKELDAMSKNPSISSNELANKALDSSRKAEIDSKIDNLKQQNIEAQTRFGNAKGSLEAKSGQSLEYGKGISSVLGGIGGLVNATMEQKAAQHDAMKAQLETQAKVYETNNQQANDFMQQMMDVIRDVRDKLSSVQQSTIETNRGIARNI